MNDNSAKKVLLIWDRMGDYHRARWRALQQLMGAENVFAADLGGSDHLYFWNETQSDQHVLLSEKPVSQSDVVSRIYNFLKTVRKNEINVIVQSGYGKAEYLFFLILATIMGKQTIIFAESWYPGNRVLDLLKGLFLRSFVNGFFVSGTRAKNHFVYRLKIPERKIEMGYSVVDNCHFGLQAEKNTVQDELRNIELNNQIEIIQSEKPYLLCVARYSVEKNLLMLIEAYKHSQLFQKWRLILIGEGSQKADLEKQIGPHNDWIKLIHWQNYSSLPYWYQHAEGLFLPSIFEPWGLVVNEAMAAKLPVFLSSCCGCRPDLLPGLHGYEFNPENIEEIKDKMNQLYSLSKEDKEKIGWANHKVVSDFSVSAWSEKLLNLILTC